MKLSHAKLLYYKAIAKLLVVPILMFILAIIAGVLGVKGILAQGIPLAGLIGFVSGFLYFPIHERLQKVVDAKVDPIYGKYYEDALISDRDGAKQGMDGETIVFDWLDQSLDKERWRVLKNEKFIGANGNKFDIDAVVIGPKGVFVFEIKNSSYDFLFTTEDCAVLVGDQYCIYSGVDPRIQVGRNAETIERLLKKKGLSEIKVKRAVVFARANSMRFLGKPVVYLIDNKEDLKKYLLEQNDDYSLTLELCESIKNTILSRK